jgi:uncharacterized protein YhjY with autotransporter beta-barrel domain
MTRLVLHVQGRNDLTVEGRRLQGMPARRAARHDLSRPRTLYLAVLAAMSITASPAHAQSNGITVDNSNPITVQSINSGNYAFGIYQLQLAPNGQTGGSTSNGVNITNTGAISVSTGNVQTIGGAGIWAVDQGGNANGSGYGGGGGSSSGVNIGNDGTVSATVNGTSGFAGIQGMSFGGNGQNYGGGGDGGLVLVKNSLGTTVNWTWQGAGSSNNGVYGVLALSQGGLAGSTNSGNSSNSGGYGGDGGTATVTLTQYGDVYVGVGGTPPSSNPAVPNGAVVAASLGGNGGSALQGNGNVGGRGGDAGLVTISHQDAYVTTYGDYIPGMVAYGAGGVGGNGGQSSASDPGSENPSQNGGGGGNTAGAMITVETVNRPMTIQITSYGVGSSPAIVAAQVGGAGGYGGYSHDSGFSTSHGGDGGSGGTAGRILIQTQPGFANAITVNTNAVSSPGIYGYSLGGAGNYGGGADTSLPGSADGGAGGAGGAGGDITVNLHQTYITTNHSTSPGIIVRSEGGIGGAGGYADDGTGSAYGGVGGTGGASGTVTVTTDSVSSIKTTYGSGSEGIFAQSLSAAGGDGGGNNGVGNAGAAGPGGTVGAISITNGASISTAGPVSRGILAQALSGAGGSGGSSWAPFHAAASSGGSGGASGAITIVNTGAITTAGDSSEGVLMQSIGGGGGAGGGASGVLSAVGGNGGSGGDGGTLDFTNSAIVKTSGASAIAVLGQSIGGGGGDAGGTSSITVAVGGNGGSAANGGSVSANLNSGSKITTIGDFAHGVAFQSIGGGGGNGGNAVADGVSVSEAIGGTGGAAGTGGSLTINTNGATITTSGNKAVGLVAQSIGGGGGTGGSAFSTSIGPAYASAVAVGGAGGSVPSVGGTVSVNMVGGSIATGQAASLTGVSSAPAQICPGTSNGACNVQPVDSFGVVVQSIGGGGGHGGGASAQAIAISSPVEPDGSQLALSEAKSVGGNGGGGGDGALAMFAMSMGATITTAGNGATGALVQSIGGGGGDGGDSSAMAASVGYSSAASPTGKAPGVSLTSTVSGNGGGAGNGGPVQVAVGGTTTSNGSFAADASGSSPTYIVTYGDYADGIKAQSIGGGGGDAGTGSGNTQNFGTGSTTSLSINLASSGSAGGNGGDTTVYLYPGKGIQTWGSAAVGIIAQSIGGGGGTSQGGSFSLGQSFSQDNGPTQKPGMSVNLGNTSKTGGTGGTVLISVAAPIVTHGNDASGVLAQSIGGGGGLGGSSGSDGSGDNPVLQAMQGREFLSDVTSWLNDGSTPQENTSLNISVGGKGGTGGAGGSVTVFLASQISTIGNPVVAGGNQQAVAGDWSHGIIAQSIGGGGGKGGSALASSRGGDWAEINASYDVAVGGSGGSGGAGGTATVNLQDGGIVVTGGYAATGVVAQSIGGGGGIGADGSDALGGRVSVGGGAGGSGGSGGAGGTVIVQEDGNTGSKISTAGTFADGINAQSIGGGGGIAGAGASVWGEYGSKHVSGSMTLTAGGGAAASGAGGNVYINPNFADNPLVVNVSGFGAYGILAQSIGGGGGNLVANQAISAFPTFKIGGLSTDSSATGGAVVVNLTWNSAITASGTAGIAVLAQSVGSGGGIIRSNDGYNTTPGLTTGYSSGIVNQTSPGKANGGTVQVTSYANISANGPGGIGIFAQSVGGGGGLILSGSTLYAGAPLQHDKNCTTSSCGGISATGNDLVVSLLGGSVSATGTNGIGIFAQSAGYGPTSNDTPTIWVGSGNPSNRVTVTGGSGSGAGVWIDRPAGNSGYSNGKVTVQEGGVLTTSVGSAGTAAMVTGGGSMTLYNLGTLVGSTVLDTADVVAGPQAWDPGPSAASGVLQSDRGSFLNSGLWVPGAQARGNVLNQGTIAFDNPAMTTRMNGHFIQTASGRLSPVIDSLNNRASLFQVDGSASVDGVIAPNAVTLLPGTVPVFTAGSLETTAQAKDSLVFDWDARRSSNTITLTPQHADFTPGGVPLSSSRSSLGSYYNRAWNNADPTIARVFAGFSHIDDAGQYKDTLDRFSSKGTQAQTIALINSSSTILGSSMSCPVFEGTGVQLTEDNCAWGQVNGRWTDQSATSDTQGYHVSGTTYRVGGQHQIASGWYLGASAAAGQTWSHANSGSTGDGDTYDGSITLKRVNGPWYFAGSLAIATGSFDSSRRVSAFGGTETTTSHPSIFMTVTRLRAGYEFAQENWYVRPYGDVDLIYTHLPGFKESGAPGYALKVRGNDQLNVVLSPMVEFGRRFNASAKSTMRTYAAVGFAYRPDNKYTLTSSFVGADSNNGTFTDYVKSPEVLAKVDVGMQLFHEGGYELRAGYTADFGHSFVSQTATARFAYHF